ncbi:MAG: calcium-binding protein, partial [Halothece sp.]
MSEELAEQLGFEPTQVADEDSVELIGTEEEDVLVAQGGNNTLLGLQGNDVLIGAQGDDILDGGLGNDLLIGGEGGDNTFQINRDLAGANLIDDTFSDGEGTIEIFDTEGNEFGATLDVPQQGIIGLSRTGANVFVDVGADGIADDLIIQDFFSSETGNEAGDGFIPNLAGVDGEEVLDFLDFDGRVDVNLQFFESDDGEVGDPINDGTLSLEQDFFVEVLVSAQSPDGISTFSLNLDFDDALLEAISDFDDP